MSLLNNTSLLSAFTQGGKTIAITTHRNPDGDALGSALGLFHILKFYHHQVSIIVPNEYPASLHFLPGDENVLIYEGNEQNCNDILMGCDFIFHLDYNSLSRVEPMNEILEKVNATSVLIDHHQEPDARFSVGISDPKASSTCELVYRFAEALAMQSGLTKDAAFCLYTGNFRYSSVTPQTLRIAANLLEMGIELEKIHAQISDANSFTRQKLLGHSLLNCLNFDSTTGVATMALTKKELDAFAFQQGDTEGFVNYGLAIQGAKLSAFFAEHDQIIKISFRSKGKIRCDLLARQHFNGGGHINAAGGRSFESMQKTLAKFHAVVGTYLEEL